MFKFDKTTRIIFTVCLIVVLIPAIVMGGGRLYNNALLWGMEHNLESTLSRGDVEILESQSVCGKLNGNGNGMEFFAAVLVTASQEELEMRISDLAEKYEVVEYVPQTEAKIDMKYLEHKSLSYDHENYTDGEYYTVYIYDSGLNSFPLDVRGH